MKFLYAVSMAALLLAVMSYTALAAGDAAKGKQIYMTTCIACHNMDPSKPGAIGPDIKGSSLELITARVMKASYPKGYKPKRNTKLMVALPHLKANLEDIAAFLNQ